jgi:hypothetical protein
MKLDKTHVTLGLGLLITTVLPRDLEIAVLHIGQHA